MDEMSSTVLAHELKVTVLCVPNREVPLYCVCLLLMTLIGRFPCILCIFSGGDPNREVPLYGVCLLLVAIMDRFFYTVQICCWRP